VWESEGKKKSNVKKENQKKKCPIWRKMEYATRQEHSRSMQRQGERVLTYFVTTWGRREIAPPVMKALGKVEKKGILQWDERKRNGRPNRHHGVVFN